MSTLTVQRVRELQEQIRMAEELLKGLSQSPEYLAEQAFIKDLQDVLELHGRTMREAVMAIDPSLLAHGPVKKARTYTKKPHQIKLAHEPAGPSERAAKTVGKAPAPEPADKPKPVQLVDTAKGLTANGKPRVRAANTGKGTDPAKAAWNAKRSAENRLKAIREGRWFVYTNPHTGETAEGSKTNTPTLKMWCAEYGRGVVDKWKRPLSAEETAHGVPA